MISAEQFLDKARPWPASGTREDRAAHPPEGWLMVDLLLPRQARGRPSPDAETVYVGLPRVTDEERAGTLEPIAWQACCRFPPRLANALLFGAQVENLAGTQ